MRQDTHATTARPAPVSLTGSELRTEMMTVTPAMAVDWLTNHNGRNRNVRPATVRRYASDITHGNWKPTHQGIAFDREGNLMDGQHRLSAIVEAGIAVDILVTRGVEPDAAMSIDTGIRRAAYDALRIAGYEQATPRFTAIVRKMMNGRETQRPGISIQSSVAELSEFLQRHARALEFASRIYTSRQKGLCLTGIIAAIARAAYWAPHAQLERFAQVLQNGMPDDRSEHVISKYRDWILQHAGEAKMGPGFSDKVYAKTERAVQAYVLGETVISIYTPKEELFPLPEDERFDERFELMERLERLPAGIETFSSEIYPYNLLDEPPPTTEIGGAGGAEFAEVAEEIPVAEMTGENETADAAAAVASAAESDAKPKRKRRTKAEMEAARQLPASGESETKSRARKKRAGSGAGAGADSDSVSPRRRKARAATAAGGGV